MSNKRNEPVVDRKVFTISIVAVVGVSLWMILFPLTSARMMQTAMEVITENFGWLFLLAGVMPLSFAGWLAFGRFGRIKLGGVDDQPEYSTVSWVAMMFTASMGASLIAWGIAGRQYIAHGARL